MIHDVCRKPILLAGLYVGLLITGCGTPLDELLSGVRLLPDPEIISLDVHEQCDAVMTEDGTERADVIRRSGERKVTPVRGAPRNRLRRASGAVPPPSAEGAPERGEAASVAQGGDHVYTSVKDGTR